MPTAVSVAPEVRSAVISGLATHLAATAGFNSGESKVEVRYGYSSAWKAAEKVYLGRARAETPPAALKSGRNFRNERGTFELIVYIHKPGTDPEEAETRAFAVAAECEDWISLRKNNELGVTNLQWLIVSGWESDLGPDGSSSGAIVRLTVAWSARLD